MTRFLLRADSGMTDVRPVAAEVFGHLVGLAQPVMIAYQSDLYHDALWLNDFLSGDESTFVWSVNESGTSIGPDDGQPPTRAHAYRFTVALVDGRACSYSAG